MNSQELRIGNWIIENLIDGPRFIQVEKIVKDDDWSDCSPIPLSSDILLKCGFEWDRYQRKYRKEGLYGTIELYNDRAHYKCYWINVYLYHLHQLQNLFYCLSGTELNITLP